MKKKMLQFVDVKQETPEKRETDKRKGDFNEIYKDYIPIKLPSNRADAHNAGSLFAKYIVL